MVVLRCTQKLLVAAETGRRPAGRRVHHAARRLVRQHPPDRPTSAPAVHQRTVSTSGRHSDSRRQAAWARCFRTPCARGWPSSASPPRTSPMSGSRMSEIGVRPDQESQLAWHLERLRIHGSIGGRATDRTRVARGADAVPLADADSPAGRREPDRVDASRVWASIGARDAPAVASLRCSIVRERLGASRLPFGAARS